MSTPNMPLFDEALAARGEPYEEARRRFLALGDRARDDLRARREDPDWHVRLLVEILDGWLLDGDLFRTAHRVARGTDASLKPEKYVTGRPPISAVVERLLELGESVAPALLEILYKQRSSIDNQTVHACNETLVRWRHPATAPLYGEILHDKESSAVHRELVMRPLVEMQPEGLLEELLAVSQDHADLTSVRAAALTALGGLDPSRVVTLLEEVLIDERQVLDLRKAAALGLGAYRRPGPARILSSHYGRARDRSLKETIIEALGLSPDPGAADALRGLLEQETDPGLQEAIRDSLAFAGVVEDDPGTIDGAAMEPE